VSTFDSLGQDNPNIRAQYDEWREARAASGEDSTDWDSFRDHVMALGAPDPGMVPTDDFVGEDWKAQNPDWVARYAGRQA
jgi:hypothetical protein